MSYEIEKMLREIQREREEKIKELRAKLSDRPNENWEIFDELVALTY